MLIKAHSERFRRGRAIKMTQITVISSGDDRKAENQGYLFDAAPLDRNEDSASKHRESGAQLDQVCPATALDAYVPFLVSEI